MNWRQREKEKYSYYVTGVTVVITLIGLVSLIINKLFF
jgi:hypothetical protein